MLGANLESLERADLELLISNGVSEGRMIEYKEALPGGSESERKEFLADVSSFANSAGGDIVYGIRERRDDEGRPTGIPEAIVGTAATNPDGEQLRLDNTLRDSIEPRIPGLRYRWIENLETGPVLIIRIPRSWSGPHMIKFQQLQRFYSRNASSKYQLDVYELRDAFLASTAIAERVRLRHRERLATILAGETPVQLEQSSPVIVHIIPHQSARDGAQIDLQAARSQVSRLELYVG
jgi:predicted HTH transcriptional regulator